MTGNWDGVLDCRGDTAVVPALLDALRTPEADGTAFQRALSELEERLVVWEGMQATYCMRSATAVAVPALAQLAQDRRVAGSGFCLDVLLQIAEAVEEGPRGTCFGVFPDRWFDAAGSALAMTDVPAWFDALDGEPDPVVRRKVLRLLALTNRCNDDILLGPIWAGAMAADDGEHLAERLVCVTAAARRSPVLDDWLSSAESAPSTTGEAIRVALDTLPDWVDGDTAQALRELISG